MCSGTRAQLAQCCREMSWGLVDQQGPPSTPAHAWPQPLPTALDTGIFPTISCKCSPKGRDSQAQLILMRIQAAWREALRQVDAKDELSPVEH